MYFLSTCTRKIFGSQLLAEGLAPPSRYIRPYRHGSGRSNPRSGRFTRQLDSVQVDGRKTHAQKVGHCPARYPPLPGPPASASLPACCQQLMYGDFTANGIAGGRAGEKVEAAYDRQRQEAKGSTRY